MSPYLIDNTDYRILQLLIEDSTLSHKDIGAMVHLTGQAVGARVRRMRSLASLKATPSVITRCGWVRAFMPL